MPFSGGGFSGTGGLTKERAERREEPYNSDKLMEELKRSRKLHEDMIRDCKGDSENQYLYAGIFYNMSTIKTCIQGIDKITSLLSKPDALSEYILHHYFFDRNLQEFLNDVVEQIKNEDKAYQKDNKSNVEIIEMKDKNDMSPFL